MSRADVNIGVQTPIQVPVFSVQDIPNHVLVKESQVMLWLHLVAQPRLLSRDNGNFLP